MTSIRSSSSTTPVPGAAKPTLVIVDDPEAGATRLSKKERKRLRRAQALQSGRAMTKRQRKLAKRRARVAITERERERLAAVHQRSADEAWRAERIAELVRRQNAAWEKQAVVPSKSMQLRLDRAARDMRQRVERGEGAFEARVLDVRFWDFLTAFDGLDPDREIDAYERHRVFASFGASYARGVDTLYDWWLMIGTHYRNNLLELVRLEVGETSVAYRPKRKCPYCNKVVRVVDRDRDEWPFLAKHRGRGKPSCPGSYYVIDDLTDVSAQPRE